MLLLFSCGRNSICWFNVGCLTPNPLLGIAGKINPMSSVVFFIMHDRLCGNYIS